MLSFHPAIHPLLSQNRARAVRALNWGFRAQRCLKNLLSWCPSLEIMTSDWVRGAANSPQSTTEVRDSYTTKEHNLLAWQLMPCLPCVAGRQTAASLGWLKAANHACLTSASLYMNEGRQEIPWPWASFCRVVVLYRQSLYQCDSPNRMQAGWLMLTDDWPYAIHVLTCFISIIYQRTTLILIHHVISLYYTRHEYRVSC